MQQSTSKSKTRSPHAAVHILKAVCRFPSGLHTEVLKKLSAGCSSRFTREVPQKHGLVPGMFSPMPATALQANQAGMPVACVISCNTIINTLFTSLCLSLSSYFRSSSGEKDKHNLYALNFDHTPKLISIV